MQKLIKIAKKKSRFIVGLMSGTSHDGVDAALIKITGSGCKSKIDLIHQQTFPYTRELQQNISKAFNGTTAEICQLNFILGEIFAEAALKLINAAKLRPDQIDAIASHGQTIFHQPPTKEIPGSTLQIGEAAIIAERTGILTISDFRTRDMAVGGHGAPLVPLADFILFHDVSKIKAVQNIGGIANVTVIPNKIEDVIAFDTGPGNALIDEVMRILSHGEKTFDEDGLFAASGVVQNILLDTLLADPYFSEPPPKSTGREKYGKEMADNLAFAVEHQEITPADLIATLTEFTAESIYRSYQNFIFPKYKISEIILSGGGSKNKFLVEKIRHKFAAIAQVLISDQLGIPAVAKEALAFAILGNETLAGRAGNIPNATGAQKAVVLGKIC